MSTSLYKLRSQIPKAISTTNYYYYSSTITNTTVKQSAQPLRFRSPPHTSHLTPTYRRKFTTTPMEKVKQHIPLAEKACEFLTNSPDPYYAVSNSVTKLEAAGYVQLRKRDAFVDKLKAGGKYYYTVNKTTLVAFAVGDKYVPGNGFKIIGGHTDSPNLKVKPISRRTGSGFTQLGIECYGGGLWHTWLDRDLGLSGRVLVREGGNDGNITQKFIKVHRPIARVSTLAIHLQSAEERAALKINKEEHLTPILGTQEILEDGIKDQLTTGGNSDEKPDYWIEKQEPVLLDLIAQELGIEVKDIADFELNLFDTQPASLGGIASEFLYSARLDNLATCFVAIESLVEYTSDADAMAADEDVSLVVLFDHEEVGSSSAQGACSPVLSEAVRRISSSMNATSKTPLPQTDLMVPTLRKSFFLSVDNAHGVHPNFASKHERNHGPKINGGIVVKTNQNQRYSTNSVTGFIVRELARKAGLAPLQEFVVRNDCGCGSTIGPAVSTATGIRTVDAGMPQLSMHSCREVMGIVDLTNGLELFNAFFKHFRGIDDKLEG